MARSLFLFVSIIFTMIMNPVTLSAANRVALTGLNPAGMVETVPLPVVEPEAGPVVNAASESWGGPEVVSEPKNVSSEPVMQTAVVETQHQPVAAAPVVQNYAVSIHIGSASEFNNTANSLSYSSIYKFRKMVYGHNTANLLGSLAYRYPGEIISITEGGVTTNYRVAAVVTYAKTADGFLEGDKRLMKNIATTALGHDVALLTCAGTPYGNGDASHRLVVYADAV